MFAILITPENLEKIHAHQLSLPDNVPFFADVYLKSTLAWYYVRGWYTTSGTFADWATIPEYILVQNYEYDPDKIKTDWDQIVRK